MKPENKELVDLALKARLNSHSPYSRFRVGAALRTKGGRIFVGTNVENASFGLSNCAERTAIFTAVTAGERDFSAIAVVADGEHPTAPCGACRQVLVEFGLNRDGSLDMEVILAGEKGADGPVRETTVSALVPDAFIDFRNPEGS